MVREVLGNLTADLVDYDGINPVIEEVVNEDQVSRDSAAFSDDQWDVHGVRVAVARCGKSGRGK